MYLAYFKSCLSRNVPTILSSRLVAEIKTVTSFDHGWLRKVLPCKKYMRILRPPTKQCYFLNNTFGSNIHRFIQKIALWSLTNKTYITAVIYQMVHMFGNYSIFYMFIILQFMINHSWCYLCKSFYLNSQLLTIEDRYNKVVR